MRPAAEAFELVTVASGARSLRSRTHGETFHPVIGPMAEAVALHVRQQRLVERAAATAGEFVIWDVGLGAAANAVAVIEALGPSPRSMPVALLSFEQTLGPLHFALTNADALGYLAPHTAAAEALLRRGEVTCGAVAWSLHAGDFRDVLRQPDLPAPHAILYDPYSPRANPELWTLEHFTALARRLDPARPCLLSNYTRSTAVRVTLLLAGFCVGRGHATGEKDETTSASNELGMLEDPLDLPWLDRVRRSTRAAPLRLDAAPGQITQEDFASLAAHPQFSGR